MRVKELKEIINGLSDDCRIDFYVVPSYPDKFDAEEDEIEDLGAPVVKGDEKKADAAKKVKQDSSVKSSQKGDQKADSVKEETESEEEEVVAEAKLKEEEKPMMSGYKSKGDAINAMVDKMKKMPAAEVKDLVAGYMENDRGLELKCPVNKKVMYLHVLQWWPQLLLSLPLKLLHPNHHRCP